MFVSYSPKYIPADSTQQKTIQNIGGASVYYKNAEDVSTSDTELEPGEAVTATEGLWFITAVNVQTYLSIRSLTLREELEGDISGSGSFRLGMTDLTKAENYTLALTDENKLLRVPDPGESAETLITIPTNTAVAFPVGSRVGVVVTSPEGEGGALSGFVAIEPAEGVEFFSQEFASGSPTETKEVTELITGLGYLPVYLLKIGTNLWVVETPGRWNP